MNLLTLFASILGINFAFFNGGCGTSACIIASNTFETTGQEVGIGLSTLGGNSIAQSFYVTTATNLKSIQLKLTKVGNFATNSGYLISVSIYSSSSNQPSSLVSTTTTLSIDNISTTASNYTFTPTQFAVTAGTTYWIVVTANYPVSTANYVKASAHEGGTNDYTLGQTLYLDNSSNWVSTALGSLRDLVFSVACSS